jgi:hypothetical protein
MRRLVVVLVLALAFFAHCQNVTEPECRICPSGTGPVQEVAIPSSIPFAIFFSSFLFFPYILLMDRNRLLEGSARHVG